MDKNRGNPSENIFENKDLSLTSINIFKNMFISMKNSERILKVTSIIAFSFIMLSIAVIIKTSPSAGYEISIYEIYPWYFWAFIIASIFLGQMVLLIWVFSPEINNNYWVIGFLGILITNTVLVFMPFIRGYTTYGRGDVLTHIGIIKDILNTASIGTNNFYPLDHILTANLSYITDISVEKAVNIIPPIFSLFYIISIYFLLREILKEKREIILVLVFASILLFSSENLMFAPSVQSFFFLPFVFYIYFRSRSAKNPWKFNLILVILLFFIVFFHPITTLFFILILLILEFCLFAHKKFDKTSELHNIFNRSSLNVTFISFTTFFIWYFSFTAITKSFKRVTNSLFQESGTSQAETYTELISRTQINFYDFTKLALNNYGQLIILSFLSLFFSLYILNKLWKKTENTELNFYHFFFSCGSIAFIFISIIFFFNDFIIGFGRISEYIFFFSSLFVGLSYYFLLNTFKFPLYKQSFKSVSLCVILIALLYFSTFNLYFSPAIKLSNQQVGQMEIRGMNWFFTHRNEEMRTLELGNSQSSFYSAIYGFSVPRENLWLEKYSIPVDHFDYLTNESLGNYYTEPRYFVLPILGRMFYQEIYPEYEELWRFTPNDFDRLEDDSSVLNIYNNGNLDIYYIE